MNDVYGYEIQIEQKIYHFTQSKKLQKILNVL